MANIRRGFAGAWACAASGAIALSNGNDRLTPTPRSRLRREMEVRFDPEDFNIRFFSPESFELKQVALDDSMHDIADPIPGALRLHQDFIDLPAIAETDRRSCRVGGKLARDVPRYRLHVMVDQFLLELADIFEGSAIEKCS
jgi:hypothetical protein